MILRLLVFPTAWDTVRCRVIAERNFSSSTESPPGLMDCLLLGTVQHFAFPEALFYRKTPRVHRHLIYTDPSPTFTIDGRTLSRKVTRGVRIYDSPLTHGCPGLGWPQPSSLFCLLSFLPLNCWSNLFCYVIADIFSCLSD